jgi:hypothetical protein
MSHSRKTTSDDVNIHSNSTSSSGKRALGETLALISSIQQLFNKKEMSEFTDSTRSSFNKIHPHQFARFYLKKIDNDDETDLFGVDSKSNTPREENDFNNGLHRSKSDSDLLKDDEGHNIHISHLK